MGILFIANMKTANFGFQPSIFITIAVRQKRERLNHKKQMRRKNSEV